MVAFLRALARNRRQRQRIVAEMRKRACQEPVGVPGLHEDIGPSPSQAASFYAAWFYNRELGRRSRK